MMMHKMPNGMMMSNKEMKKKKGAVMAQLMKNKMDGQGGKGKKC